MAPSSPIVAFVAPSGTGKTTYIERLLPRLTALGLRVVAAKHDTHSFQMDRPGKDTDRLKRSGASRVAIVNERELAVYGDTDDGITLEQLVARYLGEADLVVAEGFRAADVPQIVVCRRDAPSEPYDATGAKVIAVVGDTELPGDRPHFPLDDPAPFVAFLVERFGLGR